MTTTSASDVLLRPVRRRDRRRPVPDVPPPPGGGAALLQRAARLLRAEPLRGRRAGGRRPRHVHLRPGRDPRAHQGRHRDAARRRHLRGPADPHHPPQPAVAGVHARRRWPRSSRRSASCCAESLDPLVGAGGFDFVADLGAQMPMRVIGMLLGVPEEDQQAIRDRVDRNLRTEAGQPMEVSDGLRRAATSSPSTSTGGPSTRPTTS